MPYFPPRQPGFNGLHHLALIYGDARQPWTPEILTYYAAHLDDIGRPVDWLFDSFLFLNLASSRGRDYRADINLDNTMSGEGDFFAWCSPRPAEVTDWLELLDFYFGPQGALATLDQTLEQLVDQVPQPYGHRRNVVLMIPYPHISQRAFGKLPGADTALNFGVEGQNLDRATRQRLHACSWFVEQLVARWSAGRYRHLHLLGAYWMFESVHRSWEVDDHWLLKELRPVLHHHDLKFLWIPFYSRYTIHLLDDYQRYYFDLAFLQPNVMFYQQGVDLEAAATAARQRGAGLEMEYYLELDEPIAVTAERHTRFRAYLDGGVHHSYMTEAACAWFLGQGSLERMHCHPDAQEWVFYQDVYRFIRGTYRPAGHAAIPAAPSLALAVDLGGTHLRVAVVDDQGTLRQRWQVPTPSNRSEILEAMVALLAAGRDWVLGQGGWPAGIGVSTGGRVNFATGEVLDATALLPDWRAVPLGSYLRETLDLPVWVDNDGNCAALAEQQFGHGRGQAHFLTLVLGTGIGGGLVVNHHLVRGTRHAAAELGHISIQHDGPVCSCGNWGCVELFASGSGLAAMAQTLVEAGLLTLSPPITAEALGRAAQAGHPIAQDVIQRAGRLLGVAITGLLHTLNPQRVILSGPLTQLGDFYLQPLRQTVHERTLPLAREADIWISDLKDPGLLGAAGLVVSAAAAAGRERG